MNCSAQDHRCPTQSYSNSYRPSQQNISSLSSALLMPSTSFDAQLLTTPVPRPSASKQTTRPQVPPLQHRCSASKAPSVALCPCQVYLKASCLREICFQLRQQRGNLDLPPSLPHHCRLNSHPPPNSPTSSSSRRLRNNRLRPHPACRICLWLSCKRPRTTSTPPSDA